MHELHISSDFTQFRVKQNAVCVFLGLPRPHRKSIRRRRRCRRPRCIRRVARPEEEAAGLVGELELQGGFAPYEDVKERERGGS